MCSDRSGTPQRVPGFPIRTSTDRSLVGSSPWLIAVTHVLLRLQAPRHPPLALCSLENKDARARYGILKERNSERFRAQGAEQSLPQNGIEDRPGLKVRGRSLRSRSHRIASDQLRSSLVVKE